MEFPAARCKMDYIQDKKKRTTTILSCKEENQLILWLNENKKKGFPRRKKDIQRAVKDFLDNNPRPNTFKNNLPGDKWFRLFMRRHSNITIRIPGSITDASSKVSETDIRKWFQSIASYLEEKDLKHILNDPSRVFNGDETNFLLCPKTGRVIAIKGWYTFSTNWILF